MSVSACAVLSGEPLLGKEKAVPGSERDPTRCHPDRHGGVGGGGAV